MTLRATVPDFPPLPAATVVELSEFASLGRPADLPAFLELADARFGTALAVASSLGAEDVVLIHALAERSLRGLRVPRIFTLDTGRLPEATHELHEKLEARYGLRIEVFFPNALSVESLVRRQGPTGFYSSLEARHACCAVRKLEPLVRALDGVRAWVSGLRRVQSANRSDVELASHDGERVKLAPLAAWSDEEVWRAIETHRIPHSALHAAGYPSVGCAPCTRAVEPGAHPRSGRWWWEAPEHNECGLHVAGLRQLERERRAEVERAAGDTKIT